MGGTQLPHGTQLLISCAVGFFTGNAIDAAAQAILKITVAAIFQKDTSVFLSFPTQQLKL